LEHSKHAAQRLKEKSSRLNNLLAHYKKRANANLKSVVETQFWVKRELENADYELIEDETLIRHCRGVNPESLEFPAFLGSKERLEHEAIGAGREWSVVRERLGLRVTWVC